MTNKPPAAIQKLIEDHIKAFNTQDNKLFLSLWSDTGVVIDGIAPYCWPNPNGPAKWLADADKWREANGVSKETFTYELTFWNVEGSSAYAVVLGILAITMKDQTVVRNGMLVYTFANHNGVWKIEAQAWGRTS